MAHGKRELAISCCPLTSNMHTMTRGMHANPYKRIE